MLIVCWWYQLAFYSTLQMSVYEGDLSGRKLCVQLAESNPNKWIPLMKRFLSSTASSLNILSVRLHRTGIYAPMSVTLYMKYLFYIFSGVRISVIPFQVNISKLSCWTTGRNNIRKWRNKEKKLFSNLEKWLSHVRPVFKAVFCKYWRFHWDRHEEKTLTFREY